MDNAVSITLLIIALVTPVFVFWRVRSRAGWNAWVVAGLAVATGWALNVAWAWSVHAAAAGDAVAGEEDTLRIALMFGWVCPTVLVLLTALVMRLSRRRAG